MYRASELTACKRAPGGGLAGVLVRCPCASPSRRNWATSFRRRSSSPAFLRNCSSSSWPTCEPANDGSARAGGDAAFGEKLAQAFVRAARSLLRRVVGCPEGCAYLAKGLVLEIAEQYRGPVGIAERVHGFVE